MLHNTILILTGWYQHRSAVIKTQRQTRKMLKKTMNKIMSSGMDDIPKEQKLKSSSFATSMNAVEGIFASEETQKDIIDWQNGDKKFIAVFSATLKRYGVPVGV